MGCSQPGLRWRLSYLQTEKWLSWDFPQAFAMGVICVYLGCKCEWDAEGLVGLIMETLFPPSLFPRLFSLLVPVYRPWLGVGTIQTEEKRGLSDTCPWEEPQSGNQSGMRKAVWRKGKSVHLGLRTWELWVPLITIIFYVSSDKPLSLCLSPCLIVSFHLPIFLPLSLPPHSSFSKWLTGIKWSLWSLWALSKKEGPT